VRSLFREAYENGGIFLLDEVDAGNANVLTLLNSALSNGYFSFPDGVVKRHENFRCVAAANTFGNGADRQYVGRNQLDAATLDRFVKLNWKYDTALEGRLCTNKDWLKYVHTLRTARDKTGVRCVFSTRAVINGSDLLAAGVDRTTVEEIVLWNGISSDDREKLMEVV
jgi:MoxR-like ATPase